MAEAVYGENSGIAGKVAVSAFTENVRMESELFFLVFVQQMRVATLNIYFTCNMTGSVLLH